ncbi:MAG TPA: flagellar biosynthetic protein FliO [Clostridiaceae bacterium]|nr:flagellar biosynthetic protein FliO [Clostridiaceae bacterium]
MDFEMVFALLQSFVALLAVIVLAYVVLRAGKKLTAGPKNYVRIVEKTALSKDSYLAIAQVGSQYHLISVTSGEVRILKDIDAAEVEAVLEAKRLQFEENPLKKFMDGKGQLAEISLKKLLDRRKHRV